MFNATTLPPFTLNTQNMPMWACFGCSLPPFPPQHLKCDPKSRFRCWLATHCQPSLPFRPSMKNATSLSRFLCRLAPRTPKTSPNGLVFGVRGLAHLSHPCQTPKTHHPGMFYMLSIFHTSRLAVNSKNAMVALRFSCWLATLHCSRPSPRALIPHLTSLPPSPLLFL